MTLDQAAAANGEAGIRVVPVALGARAYDIMIGPDLLPLTAKFAAAVAPGARAVIVTDDVVARHHLDAIEKGFREHGELIESIVLPAGEATKSFDELGKLSGRLLEIGVERGDIVIAFGGGVIGDLAAFAASILRRGVRLVQVPTTLLAQVDSAIGGKTGINTEHGKNLIGSFHQPSLVIADTGLLATLPERQLRAGYAEIVKYGLIGNPEFFGWLEQNWQRLFAGESQALGHAIEMSCRAKAAFVEQDERESDRRALLNLGHTFAHALEIWSGYSDRLLHGEAVAIGMALAFEFSEQLGHCATRDRERVMAHLSEVGLPVAIAEIPGEPPDAATLLRHKAQDKKVSGGKPALILAQGIGRAFIERSVPMDQLETFLQRKCEDR
jgi:3-dehydroquinate synthase